MRSIQIICVILLICTCVRAGVVTAPHAIVNYDGIDPPQAEAIAQTISAAWMVYTDDFGFEMTGTIQCNVRCGPAESQQLFTDGVDTISALFSSRSQLDQPRKTGIYTLYGLCHELGHIAMYQIIKPRRDLIMRPAMLEGWAHYAGSVVTDRVYEIKGPALWPDAYDYRQDGIARLDRAFQSGLATEVDLGANRWRALDQIVGEKNIPKIFRAIQDATISNPLKPSDGITAALKKALTEKQDALELWWSASAVVFIDPIGISAFKRETISPDRLTGKPIQIALDDDKSDGMRSFNGGGHARRFSVPEPGEWYLVAVWIYGSRYGPPQPPVTQFEIYLCDSEINPVNSWSRAYSTFPYGAEPQAKWVRFELTPTRVPDEFTVSLDFHPSARSGIYVHFDSSRSGQSLVGLPGTRNAPFAAGEWMIRAEIDRVNR